MIAHSKENTMFVFMLHSFLQECYYVDHLSQQMLN